MNNSDVWLVERLVEMGLLFRCVAIKDKSGFRELLKKLQEQFFGIDFNAAHAVANKRTNIDANNHLVFDYEYIFWWQEGFKIFDIFYFGFAELSDDDNLFLCPEYFSSFVWE